MFELDGIRVTFGRRLALEIDRLTLAAGTSVAVMGPNGSGKTTLLRLLAGLVDPDAGSIGDGGDRGHGGGGAGERGGRRGVAYVAQHQHQHAWMPLTVGEVLAMGRYRQRGLLGRLNGADRRLLADAASRLSVDDLLGRAFGELSGGQRQRVLVAGALASDAGCLLLDEPITGLDLPSQQLILDVVAEERDRGRLVVLTTHHLDEARHCDRVLLLDTAVVADGSPGDVLTPTELAKAFGTRMIGSPGDDAITDDLIIVFDEHGHEHRHGDGHGHRHVHVDRSQDQHPATTVQDRAGSSGSS